MAWQPYVYETMIREFHLDTFGHVNNAQYLVLMEEARWEMITSRGYGLQQVKAAGKGPVMLEVDLKFKKELKLRERIRIELIGIDWSGKIGKFKQTVYNQAGDVSADALWVAALFDLKERKIIPPTPEWMKAIGWVE